MASLLIAHDITKLNYNGIAAAFGQGATYDSIESRFRPIRGLMKQLRTEAAEHGVDLTLTPRGRQRGSETSTAPPQSSTAPSGVAKLPLPPLTNSRKKLKKDDAKTKAQEFIDLSQDSDKDEDLEPTTSIDSDNPLISRFNPEQRLMASHKGVNERDRKRSAADAVLARSRNLNPTVSGERLPDSGPNFQTISGKWDDMDRDGDTEEDDYEDLPLAPRRRRMQRANNIYQSPNSSPDQLALTSQSQDRFNVLQTPNDDGLHHSRPPYHSNAEAPQSISTTLQSNANSSRTRTLFDFPPSPKLYREPPGYSTTTSMSNENAPFLPRRTASRSSPSPLPTRFSSVDAYRPTTEDFLPPDDMLPPDWIRNLNLATDERGLPIIPHQMSWSPSPASAPRSSNTDNYSGAARSHADQPSSNKSTSSKSNCGSSSWTGNKRVRPFFTSADTDTRNQSFPQDRIHESSIPNHESVPYQVRRFMDELHRKRMEKSSYAAAEPGTKAASGSGAGKKQLQNQRK
ncbi:hypothetical protein UCRPC4_g00614 [Phaeomoniella chlamydospora]|uniref:Uncharacterized protein n=1 Tax=Phaeomoniella chlamydospora TaxID=158046 RepID=A0A0G2F2E4_PHACM|nr:hypothetical protein UCRPC4_g00614 [Phaeomoniella chlamydospora]